MTLDAPPVAGTRRALVEDGLVAAMLVAVPLAFLPALRDPFTAPKWHALSALAVAAAVCFAATGVPVPSFARRHRALLGVLGALALASALRTGVARGLGPLLDRFTVVVAVLLLYAHLRRRRSDLTVICFAAAAGVAVTVGLVLAEQAGLRPFRVLEAGDGRSALFGNVNMAAQFLALATPCLLWAGARARRPAGRIAMRALLAATLASIALLGGRSAALATGVVLLVWIGRRAVPALVVGAALAGAIGVAAMVWLPGSAARPASSADTLASKAAATSIRLGLWRGTARMIRDHPLGVGAANFPDRFVPYQLGALLPDEGLLYRWPHDEWLRVAAEDGLPFAALAFVAAGLLVRDTRRALRARRPHGAAEDEAFVVSLALALAVEATFQFPFAMAAGALAAAVLVAVALSLADEKEILAPVTPRRRVSPALGWTLAAAGGLIALLRIGGADYVLARHPHRRAALEKACALDPRRADACVLAAWRQLAAGDGGQGRRTLARVLEHSPYYYPALKLRAEVALAAGDRDEACRSLALYDGLFAASSSLHAALSVHCPGIATTDVSLDRGASGGRRDGS